MKLYHRTTRAIADIILEQGFRDGKGRYGTGRKHRGVWLSNVPLDENKGATGDTLLDVWVHSTEQELRRFEWVEEGKGYRGWFDPSRLGQQEQRCAYRD